MENPENVLYVNILIFVIRCFLDLFILKNVMVHFIDLKVMTNDYTVIRIISKLTLSLKLFISSITVFHIKNVSRLSTTTAPSSATGSSFP